MLGISIYLNIKHAAFNADLKDVFAAVTTPNWQWRELNLYKKTFMRVPLLVRARTKETVLIIRCKISVLNSD